MLRQILAEHVKSNQKDTSCDEKMAQASVQTDFVNNVVEPVPQNVGCSSHAGGVDGHAQVLVELLRQVSPLSSEDPEGILRLFVRLEKIHNLGQVEGCIFVTRVLLPVSGSMYACLGVACLVEAVWQSFFFPMPPHVRRNVVVFPPGCGDSVADF